MKIVFFGTPDYVLPVLSAIHKKFVTGPGVSPIVAVVTASPKPVGRRQILTYSPIDKWAHEHKIPIFYRAKDFLEGRIEADFGVLASYGEIIPPGVINSFPKGILVIHPSLLPKFRGASPIPAAIINGETKTGVTIFKMDEKVDHGKIISQFKEDILPDDNGETLRNRLFEKSADVLTELIEPYLRNKIVPRVQDESEATFTKITKKDDGFIKLEDFATSLRGDSSEATEIERKLRAFYPWPGVWTKVKVIGNSEQRIEKRLKILKAHLEKYSLSPIGYKLVLDEVQLEGKNPVSWKQFNEAYPNLAARSYF